MAINPKEKTFEIDVDNPTPLSWTFGKADALKLTFVFKKGLETYDTTGVAKLRVFAFKVLANGNTNPTGQQLFGGEFTSFTSGFIATFDSAQTSAESCQAIMTVQLVDSSENLINSANVNLNIYETNSQTPYNPTPNYRDEVLDAKDIAVASATKSYQWAESSTPIVDEQGVAIGDSSKSWAYTSNIKSLVAEGFAVGQQDGADVSSGSYYYNNNAKYFNEQAYLSASYADSKAQQAQQYAEQTAQAAGVRDLQTRASNVGYYQFDGGLLRTQKKLFTSAPFSFAFKYERAAAWTTQNDYNLFTQANGYSTVEDKFIVWGIASSGGLRFVLSTASGGGTGSYAVLPYTALPTGDDWHSVVFTVPSATVADWGFYVDGTYIAPGIKYQGTFTGTLTTDLPFSINANNATAITGSSSDMAYKNILAVNFDMSANGAEYKVSDYAEGRDVPTSSSAMLVLSDTADGAQVRDLSGNNNHATIIGNSVLPSKKATIAVESGVSTWSGTTAMYLLADSNILPANSKIEFIAQSSAVATLTLGSYSGGSEYGTMSATTSFTQKEFYTGTTATHLSVTPSVANITLTYSIRITPLQ